LILWHVVWPTLTSKLVLQGLKKWGISPACLISVSDAHIGPADSCEGGWKLVRLCQQSRRHGGAFVGLASPNKTPRPPNWNLEHYKSVEFLSILNIKPPSINAKPPPHKRKAPLLTTFWRRLCVSGFPTMVKVGRF